MASATDVFPSGSGVGLNIAAFFKTRYPQRKLENLVEFGKPFLERVRKSDELTGITTVVPFYLDTPQGMSASLATALTNATSSFGATATITTADGYAGLTIDAKTMMASKNNEGAFFRIKEREMDGILDSLGQRFEMALWQKATGSLGTLSADPGTGTTFTLAKIADALNFHKNMTILFYADSSGDPGSVRAGGARTVSGVNYDTGVITVTAALDAALAATDHVVREGDVNAMFTGIPSWIPSADPTGTTFGGITTSVDRSLHPQQLGGWRQSWKGSIESTVKALAAKVHRVSQAPKTLWVSYDNFNVLEVELGARGTRVEDGGTGKFSRPALMMTCPSGPVTVIAGPYVPSDAAYLLDMSTWAVLHLGGFPHIVNDDGLTVRVMGVGGTPTDGIEIRYRYFAQLFCYRPFSNGRAEII